MTIAAENWKHNSNKIKELENRIYNCKDLEHNYLKPTACTCTCLYILKLPWVFVIWILHWPWNVGLGPGS